MRRASLWTLFFTVFLDLLGFGLVERPGSAGPLFQLVGREAPYVAATLGMLVALGDSLGLRDIAANTEVAMRT